MMTVIHFQGNGNTLYPTPQFASPSIYFGSDRDIGNGDVDELDLGAVKELDEAEETGFKGQLLDEAEEFKAKLKKNELVKGAQKFIGVLSKALPLNGLLKDANPESSISDRAYAIIQLAFAEMNDVVQSAQSASSRPDGSNTYYSVLSSFPGLLLYQDVSGPGADNGEINVVDKAIEASAFKKPATVRANINKLVAEYGDVDLEDDTTRAELSHGIAKAFGVRVR